MASLSGRVSVLGFPVANKEMNFSRTGVMDVMFTIYTDASGNYVFDGMALGTWHIYIGDTTPFSEPILDLPISIGEEKAYVLNIYPNLTTTVKGGLVLGTSAVVIALGLWARKKKKR